MTTTYPKFQSKRPGAGRRHRVWLPLLPIKCINLEARTSKMVSYYPISGLYLIICNDKPIEVVALLLDESEAR